MSNIADDILIASRTHLLTNPSVIGWKSELGKILRGERQNDILTIGSASDYIGPYLATKHNRAGAEAIFIEALEAVFRRWQPEPKDKEYVLTEVKTGNRENGLIEIVDGEKIAQKPIVTKGAYALLMKLKNKSDE